MVVINSKSLAVKLLHDVTNDGEDHSERDVSVKVVVVAFLKGNVTGDSVGLVAEPGVVEALGSGGKGKVLEMNKLFLCA